MAKIKIGIIGCGTIANSAHIPSYMANPDVEIKYFCDILPEKAKAAVEKYGCGIAIEDYHDIIADPEQDALDHLGRLPARRQARPLREAGGPHLCGRARDAEGAA